jgi:DNA-binding NarL/FixJ family response regulator
MRDGSPLQRRDAPPARYSLSILGSRNLQNELLSHVLAKEFGAMTCIVESLDSLPSDGMPGRTKRVLFVDSVGKAPVRILEELQRRDLCSQRIVAIYNLRHGTGIEHRALKQGIKGFFYDGENLSLFLKGVKILLQGEVWLSRDILVECVINGVGKRADRAQLQAGLTQREMEVLALIASGANNEEIAGKIFISPNTVKTHLYNIFRKINVPNRLQAALWATKNLELE